MGMLKHLYESDSPLENYLLDLETLKSPGAAMQQEGGYPSHPIFQQRIHVLSLEDHPRATVHPCMNHMPLSSCHWLESCLQGFLVGKAPNDLGQDPILV